MYQFFPLDSALSIFTLDHVFQPLILLCVCAALINFFMRR